MMPFIYFLLLITIACTLEAFPYPPEIPQAKEHVYKKTLQGDLRLWVFTPKDHCSTDARPAVVFFFGGGWKKGSPAQFVKQCEYLASRGMVAITTDYRVLERHKTKADSCVKDGKSAIRWVRENAEKLGVDPNRIAAGGGSAGGHIAAAVGLIKELEECGENLNISSRPNALILFNPAVTLLSIDGKYEFPASKTETMEERTGVPPRQLSPYHHINRGLPPTIIFHGTEDDAVHYETVALFEKKMLEVGNLCKLVSFPGEPHGFFNFGRGGNENFRKTMVAADMFLQDLGWLNGQENVDAFLERN